MKTKLNCLNCETPLHDGDKFCPKCGQENRDLQIGFWEFASEFLSNNFNFDTKLGHTLKDLLLKPGEITKQFLAGKRVKYVKPLQLYFFVSFVYFLLLGYSTSSSDTKPTVSETQIEELNDRGIIVRGDGSPESEEMISDIRSTDPNDQAAIDSIVSMFGENPQPWKRHLAKQMIRGFNPEYEDAFRQEFLANLSVTSFFFLPVFAFILWLFTRKKSPYLMNAMIFSIHLHTVAFTLFSLDMLIGIVFDEMATTLLFMGLTVVYLLLALKRVYGFSWFGTFGRFVGTFSIYLVCLSIGMLGTVLFSFWKY